MKLDSRYKFISPLLECNIDYDYYNPGSIKKDIEKYISKSKKSWNIHEVSYYVRLLENGSTFWYNENLKFFPASLVKLPFAISLMRYTSFDELQKIIQITKVPEDTFSWDEYPDLIKYWENYSLYTLLAEMLINSDNTASLNLFEYMSQNKKNQTYKDFWLWIVDFTSNNSLDMSAKNLSSFFRILYNSSYLEREKSEELLGLLSKSTFLSWIQAPIPKEITVANKFWANGIDWSDTYIHDCWIIYTNSPYVLCVMTYGNNKNEQLKIIRDISKMVYDDLKKD